MTTEQKTRHHHGDLKNALVQAGLEILEEGGIDALSLRKCAARAGVSHAAPAHHFGNLDGLKSAIAAAAFALFSQSMREAAAQEGDSDLARLKGICRGYLQFGMQHKGLLDVMFGLPPDAFLKLGDDLGDSDSYNILRDACAPFVPDGRDPFVTEFQVWSLVHGYTQLYVSGRFGGGPQDTSDEGPFDQVMALLDGLQGAAS
jgi:AcrR family transcriptional regulator